MKIKHGGAPSRMHCLNESRKRLARCVLASFVLGSFAVCAAPDKPENANAPAQLAASNELLVYSSRPLESWHITVADFESQQIMTGAVAVVPKPEHPRVP